VTSRANSSGWHI